MFNRAGQLTNHAKVASLVQFAILQRDMGGSVKNTVTSCRCGPYAGVGYRVGARSYADSTRKIEELQESDPPQDPMAFPYDEWMVLRMEDESAVPRDVEDALKERDEQDRPIWGLDADRLKAEAVQATQYAHEYNYTLHRAALSQYLVQLKYGGTTRKRRKTIANTPK